MASPFWQSFMDGLTGGGLLHGLKRPGDATQVFADPGDCSFDPIIHRVMRDRAAKGQQSDSSYIVSRYPELFDLSGDVPTSSMHIGFQGMGEGWLVLMAKLCQRLEPIAADDFKIISVKPKFGRLRIAYRGGDETIEGMVEAAKAEALTMCEICGTEGEMRGEGWSRRCPVWGLSAVGPITRRASMAA